MTDDDGRRGPWRVARVESGMHAPRFDARHVIRSLLALCTLVPAMVAAQQAAGGVGQPVVDSGAVRAVRAAAGMGRGYLFGSNATIAMERPAPQPPLVDTVTTLARLGVTLEPGVDGGAVAALFFDSLVVRSTGLVRRPATAALAGESMRVRLDDGRVARVVPADGRSACDGEAPLAALLAELVPAVRSMDPGASWSDTTTVLACRTGVPVTVTTVWRYTVRDESGPALALQRDGTVAIAGEATIREQRLVMSGAGTTTGTITVDRTTRALRTLRATGTTTFEITNGQQSRRFTQVVVDEVRLLSP